MTLGGHQHDPGSPDVFLQAVTIGDDRKQPLAVTLGHGDTDSGSHALDSHVSPRRGNPSLVGILPSGFIH